MNADLGGGDSNQRVCQWPGERADQPRVRGPERRYLAWFHELEADFFPRGVQPAAFLLWTQMALGGASPSQFADAVRTPAVAPDVLSVQDLQARAFAAHFGDPRDRAVQNDYLEATFRFAIDTLPPEIHLQTPIPSTLPAMCHVERPAHGDLMWFVWAHYLDAIQVADNRDGHAALRALLMAGVATGCPADIAWRGHGRTRSEYRRDDATARLLRRRGLAWARDFQAGSHEVQALFRIREWGEV